MPLEKMTAADRPPTKLMIQCLKEMVNEGFTLYHNARGTILYKKTGSGKWQYVKRDVVTQTLYGLHERGLIETDWDTTNREMQENPFACDRAYKITQKGLDALPP